MSTPAPLLTIDELAAELGLAKATLREWCGQKRIPFLKLGRAVRFRREDIDRWLGAHTIAPARERPDLPTLVTHPARRRAGAS